MQKDANQAFYGQPIPALDLLTGKVPPPEAVSLCRLVRAAKAQQNDRHRHCTRQSKRPKVSTSLDCQTKRTSSPPARLANSSLFRQLARTTISSMPARHLINDRHSAALLQIAVPFFCLTDSDPDFGHHHDRTTFAKNGCARSVRTPASEQLSPFKTSLFPFHLFVRCIVIVMRWSLPLGLSPAVI